ncbi:MAG: SDR family NAD(P)-dependent oxidoreductase [Candidatus Binatia bacterium]|nr:SDR family NAD(P)-dependent oxidoreductase [Candidatus Binatia bacterium]
MADIAFVTGASRGIGRAASIALAEKGFDVVLAARTMREGDGRARGSSVNDEREVPVEGSLEETADRVRALGSRALPLRLDLLDAESIDAAADAAIAEWGRVDLLLNNAIYQGPGRMDRLLDLPLETVKTIFHANVVSQIQLTTRLLPGMIEHGGGTIINMTSGSGQMDPPGPVGQGGWGFAYAASKAAFHRMAGILHVEHRDDGIRAFNVDPGYTPTAAMRALRGASNDLDDHFRGAPPDVAGRVIGWLATDAGAAEWEGKAVNAQRLCRKLKLLPGWPAERPDS